MRFGTGDPSGSGLRLVLAQQLIQCLRFELFNGAFDISVISTIVGIEALMRLPAVLLNECLQCRRFQRSPLIGVQMPSFGTFRFHVWGSQSDSPPSPEIVGEGFCERLAVEADVAPQVRRELDQADRLDAIPPQITPEAPARGCLAGLREQDRPWAPMAIASERGRQTVEDSRRAGDQVQEAQIERHYLLHKVVPKRRARMHPRMHWDMTSRSSNDPQRVRAAFRRFQRLSNAMQASGADGFAGRETLLSRRKNGDSSASAA
jgi:hypothetical protein